MQDNTLLLGIDIGTTGTKCTIYRTNGEQAAHAYTEYPMIHPHEAWTEQDPHRWWEAVIQNLSDIFKNQGINNSQIAAIGLSCTNAVTLVDQEGEPVYNAIGHQDKRADAQVEWLKEHVGEELVETITGNKIDKGSFCLPSIKWIFDNKPEAVSRAYKILMPSGYIIQKLTGRFTMNKPRMSLTILDDIRKGNWSKEIAEKAGIPISMLPDPCDPAEIVGTVTKEAAAATGLLEGTPVSGGCLDTVVSTMASGAVDKGDIALTIGSSGRICYISDTLGSDRRMLMSRSPFEGLYTIVQSTDNAGVSLRWFRDVFGESARAKAKEQSISVYDYMDALAGSVPAGCDGLLYLPYLAGEKSPIWDSDARGVFFGMSLNSNYNTFIRAIMEGVAFSIRDCIEIIPKNGASVSSPIPFGGGASRSPLWCQIVADVLNRPIIQLETAETETLGDMMIAAQSIGIPEIDKYFGKKLASNGRLFRPVPENVSEYNKGFIKYRNIYQHLKEDFKKN